MLASYNLSRSDFVREIAKHVGAPSDSTILRDVLENAITMIAFL